MIAKEDGSFASAVEATAPFDPSWRQYRLPSGATFYESREEKGQGAFLCGVLSDGSTSAASRPIGRDKFARPLLGAASRERVDRTRRRRIPTPKRTSSQSGRCNRRNFSESRHDRVRPFAQTRACTASLWAFQCA